MRNLKICLVVFFFALGISVSLAQNKTPKINSDNNTQTKSKSAPIVDMNQYVGSKSCAECHASEATHYALTPHNKTNSGKDAVNKQGCEACHGPARGHVDFYLKIQKLNEAGKEDEATVLMNDTVKAAAAKLLSFKNMSSASSSAICLKCHEGTQGRSEERFNFRRSEHHRHGISCNECHSSHSPKQMEFLLKAVEPGLCYRCHADQKASFAKPFHHKVPEGGMKCSDCHNQHGGFMAKSLRSSYVSDYSCLKCHADKQGPFTYEHAPIKVEGCQSCHTPHGSTNPKLLTRNSVKFLCLECHSNTPGIPDTDGTGIGPGTPSFHAINNPRYANCTVCHIDIHGSNKDPFFR